IGRDLSGASPIAETDLRPRLRAEEPGASRPAMEREIVLGERDLAGGLLRRRRVEDARAAFEGLDRVPAEREVLADLAEGERVRDAAQGAATGATTRAAGPERP